MKKETILVSTIVILMFFVLGFVVGFEYYSSISAKEIDNYKLQIAELQTENNNLKNTVGIPEYQDPEIAQLEMIKEILGSISSAQIDIVYQDGENTANIKIHIEN